MPSIRYQEDIRGRRRSNAVLMRPAATPAILLWVQSEPDRRRLPAQDMPEIRAGRRASLLFAAVLCGGLALASTLPPKTDAGPAQVALKTRSGAEIEADEHQMLRLARTPEKHFDRAKDLASGFSGKPAITILREPLLDDALSALASSEESKAQPQMKLAPSPPTFVQEFWRAIGHTHLSDAYAAYIGRYSGESVEAGAVLDLDVLSGIEEEEKKRLDARMAKGQLHISLLEVPKPRRAPRGARFKMSAAKATRKGCRNRIWRCAPDDPISHLAQGSARRFRSRHN
jgi:hypothetical protein